MEVGLELIGAAPAEKACPVSLEVTGSAPKVSHAKPAIAAGANAAIAAAVLGTRATNRRAATATAARLSFERRQRGARLLGRLLLVLLWLR